MSASVHWQSVAQHRKPCAQREYIRSVKKLAAFLAGRRTPATAEDVRASQVRLTETGANPPTINAHHDRAAVLLQGHARSAGDVAASDVRVRATQAAARAAEDGRALCWFVPEVSSRVSPEMWSPLI